MKQNRTRYYWVVIVLSLLGVACTAPRSEEGLAVLSSPLCTSQNVVFCDWPLTTGDCETCGGSWTTSGGYCDQTELCNTPALCSDLCAGGWIDGVCRTHASQEDCLAYAALHGNVSWTSGAEMCTGQDTALCFEPSDSATCAVCSGTWSE